MGTRRLSWRPLVASAGALIVFAASHSAAWATNTALTDQAIPISEVSNAVTSPVDSATVEDVVNVVDEVIEDAQATVSEVVDTVEKVIATAAQPPGDIVVSSEVATAVETAASSPADAGGTNAGRDSSESSAAQKDKKRKDRDKDNAKELVSAGHEIAGPVPLRTRVKASIASRLAHTGANLLGFLLVGLTLVASGGGVHTASRARAMPIGVGR